jgi:hypothetical protein
MTNPAPECASVESFVEFCLDDERDTFSHEDLVVLNFSLRKTVAVLRGELEAYGLRLAPRIPPKKVRGFTTSSNDRWFGPGSCPTSGGAAYGAMMTSKYGSKDTPFG